MPSPKTFFPLTLPLVLTALLLACGSNDDGQLPGGGNGGGGEGGQGDLGELGTCVEPLDFEALSKDRGSVRFVEESVDRGEALNRGSCGGKGAELVYHWTAPRQGRVRLGRIERTDHLYVYVRTSCTDPGSELGCANVDPVEWFDVAADQKIFIFVDSDGTGDPFFELAITFIPTDLAKGERCALDGSLGLCGQGLACGKKEGKCEINVPTILHTAIARHNPEFNEQHVRFKVTGTAPKENADHLAFRFYDEEGAPMKVQGVEELYAELDDVFGLTEFTAYATTPYDDVSDVHTFEVEIVDTAGERSNTLEMQLEPPDVVEEDGAPCDRFRIIDVCGEGLYCQHILKEPDQCEEALPPSVISVIFNSNQKRKRLDDGSFETLDELDSLAILFELEDPNADIYRFRYRLYDEDDQLVANKEPEEDGMFDGRFNQLQWDIVGLTPVTLSAHFFPTSVSPAYERVVRMEFQIVDITGLRSELQSVDVVPYVYE